MSTVPGLRRAWCTELGGFWSGSLRSTLGGGTLDWIFSGPLASALGGGTLDWIFSGPLASAMGGGTLDWIFSGPRIGSALGGGTLAWIFSGPLASAVGLAGLAGPASSLHPSWVKITPDGSPKIHISWMA